VIEKHELLRVSFDNKSTPTGGRRSRTRNPTECLQCSDQLEGVRCAAEDDDQPKSVPRKAVLTAYVNWSAPS